MGRLSSAVRMAVTALAVFHEASSFTSPRNNLLHVATTTTQRSNAGTIGTMTTTSLGVFSSFNRKKEAESEQKIPAAIPGIGEEGCILPSPSGVNTMPESQQAAVFVAIYAGLGLGTYLLNSFLGEITLQYEWVQSWRYSWPILLGLVYVLLGATHFIVDKDYANIYPTKGAWGFWNLPGSPQFHVQWTGVAEILGGLGLLIGGFYDAFLPPYTQFPNVLTPAGIGYDAAAGLFLLTLAVTPANIFMYTHGARLPMYMPDGEVGPELPVVGHAVRGVVQIVLLAMLYQLGDGTFDSIASGTFGCPTC